MDLKETTILGAEIESHWYYSTKAKAMTKMLDGTAPKSILDIGAGSGFFSRHLLANTTAEEAWCIDISYANEYDGSEGNKVIHYRRSVDKTGADLVLLMDVLEHVDDDVALLKGYVNKVPCGSKFIITVPAFNFLWSGHDDFLEHKRRYTIAQLRQVVNAAGLKIRRDSYFFGLVFPIAASLRLVQKFGNRNKPHSQLAKHHPLVNAFLKLLCSAELPLMHINRAAGLTVFCVAEKT